MTNNPSPQPIADREADGLAELSDRVADLRESVKYRNGNDIADACRAVEIATGKAYVRENYSFVIDCILVAITGVAQYNRDATTRQALKYVVSAIEAIVKEEARERAKKLDTRHEHADPLDKKAWDEEAKSL